MGRMLVDPIKLTRNATAPENSPRNQNRGGAAVLCQPSVAPPATILGSNPTDSTRSPTRPVTGRRRYTPRRRRVLVESGAGNSLSAVDLLRRWDWFRRRFRPYIAAGGGVGAGGGIYSERMAKVNEIRLEEKEKTEKEMRLQIIEDADEYKIEFHRKREVNVENTKSSNREREKLFLASGEKFHAEADKNYWKAIGELIPREVPGIEKRGKKDKENKPSIVVIQGPKPGKPTDLSRTSQILLKLKHNPPPHMKPKPPPSSEPKKDAKTGPPDGPSTSTAPPKIIAVATPEAVAAA